MEPDDDIRSAIRRFAGGEVTSPDMLELRRRTRQRTRRQRWERGLAAAVILGILVGIVALVGSVWADPTLDEPIGPSPTPTTSASPSPIPTPDPTPSASAPALPFPVSPGSGANPDAVGGLGDVIDGLRLDDVDITASQCPNGEACPSDFALRFTNTTNATGTWEVMVYVYYNSVATIGNGTVVTLDAGESALADVSLDIDQDSSQSRDGTYSWNWSAVLSN